MTTRHHHHHVVATAASREKPISVVRSVRRFWVLCVVIVVDVVDFMFHRHSYAIRCDRAIAQQLQLPKKKLEMIDFLQWGSGDVSLHSIFFECQLKKLYFLQYTKLGGEGRERMLNIFSWMEEARKQDFFPSTLKCHRTYIENPSTSTSNPSCIVSIYDTKSQ